MCGYWLYEYTQPMRIICITYGMTLDKHARTSVGRARMTLLLLLGNIDCERARA